MREVVGGRESNARAAVGPTIRKGSGRIGGCGWWCAVVSAVMSRAARHVRGGGSRRQDTGPRPTSCKLTAAWAGAQQHQHIPEPHNAGHTVSIAHLLLAMALRSLAELNC